jgi:hypothetical protein
MSAAADGGRGAARHRFVIIGASRYTSDKITTGVLPNTADITCAVGHPRGPRFSALPTRSQRDRSSTVNPQVKPRILYSSRTGCRRP